MLQESSCCSVMRKMGGKKCPICRKPIKLALVLRLLRYDASRWWYHMTLREQGRIEEAIKLERRSVRDNVRFIRRNIARDATTHRDSVIEFLDRPTTRPFDFSIVKEYSGSSYTAMVSGCHPGGFAAWVYCYAHRIGWKPQPKQFDTV